MERIIIQNTKEPEKKYPKDELILDEYICEHCGMRYEFCSCEKEKDRRIKEHKWIKNSRKKVMYKFYFYTKYNNILLLIKSQTVADHIIKLKTQG